ncbi:4-alpha-glucanotransferase [Peptostreptococcus stomatis]|uniref:4-alpha-glucanotransferase n=1 Tax=Peptostreptococcus stomatis TaxID=341694 RepID=UPI0028D37605|nr:4-alpha-glucanotransferase [Peptostreptococcus stomatis]
MTNTRKAGILLPVFSLPSRFGVGSLGQASYEFVDLLARTGQSIWQILPLTATAQDEGYSPYKSASAFSGNYDLIDIDQLVEKGLLDWNFVNSVDQSPYHADPRYVDYGKTRALKMIFFREAFKNFNPDQDQAYKDFKKENAFWLDDFAMYMALKEANGEKPYWEWPNPKNEANPNTVDFHCFLQYLFFDQWHRLKNYANDRGIEIFGDMPIYVSRDSSDFYYNRDMFLTDEKGEPNKISGVPPDEFSATGQVWGNPLYDWDYLKDHKFDWWIKRIKKSLELYDIVRIDHFRGLESFYCIDPVTKDAMNGQWVKAPGKELFDQVNLEIKDAKIIAEDLGIITNEVRDLLEYTGFPGMKIVQFGFSSDASNLNLPHNYPKNSVAYTGTHDNNSLAEWLKTCSYGEFSYAEAYLRMSAYDRYTESLIRAVMMSNSDLAIIPLQDWYDFEGWSRLNTPGIDDGNWVFRMLHHEMHNRDLEGYISYITGLYGRYKNR